MQIKDLAPAEARDVSALLDEALALQPHQRAAWRAELAQRDSRLCDLVCELLESIESGSHRDTPSQIETVELIARGVAQALPDEARFAGRRFGPYRVLRLLGQGGMGSVWLAERADGLFERRVALKLVHASLVGAALNERFARERSILGTLAHPNIARLLDAGVAEHGQPYLALEYVEGTPLTTYCDQNRLTLHSRIGLVNQVLAAVQYAHQNLVIHRDLKPANILVTAGGEVRLLDFGIAKLMTDGQAHETELTQQGGRALTPDYASPEQIAGQPVSTASDVYSIGVVLYVLLCGQRLYRLQRDSRGALEEAILSMQPVKPSLRDLGAKIAGARSTTPKKLAQALAGDLDTIVLKALKKDPAERYATADALMHDLQRHLAGRPVQARPDSAAYRLAKFVGRHRLQVSAGLAVGVVLLAAAGVSIWQGQLARVQQAVAEREAQRAQTVQQFLLDIFKANSVEQPDPVRARQTTARELLDIGARQAAESLKRAPQAQEAVLTTMADMYYQLGLHDDAARMRQQRVAALKQAHGPNDVRVAQALLEFANDVADTDQRAHAVTALAEARMILDRIGDRSSETRGWVSIESARIEQYVSIGAARRDADEAVRHFRAYPGSRGSVFHALQASARARYLAGSFEEAEVMHREALAEAARKWGASSAWVVTPLVQIAEAQAAALKLAEAETNFRAALALSHQLNGSLSGPSLQTQAKLGSFLHASGRRDEGQRLLDDVWVAIGKKDANATPNVVSAVHVSRGIAQLNEGRIKEAETSFAIELVDLRAHYPNSLPLSRTLLRHAAALTALGRYEASRAELDEAWLLWQTIAGDAVAPAAYNRHRLEQARLLLAQHDAAGAEAKLQGVAPPRSKPALPEDDVQAQLMLAQVRALQGRPDDAQRLAQHALEQVQTSPLRERFPRLEAEAALRLGQALQQARQAGAARPHLEQALALREATESVYSPWLAEARVALAECLLDQGDRSPALALANQARAAHATHDELGAHFKAPLEKVLARLASR